MMTPTLFRLRGMIAVWHRDFIMACHNTHGRQRRRRLQQQIGIPTPPPVTQPSWAVWLRTAATSAVAMAVAIAGVTLVGANGTSHTLLEENKQKAKNINNNHKSLVTATDISNIPSCLPRKDVSILVKNGRMVYLVGAVNYSKESSDLVAAMIQQVQPNAVFLDINQRILHDFGIDQRVEHSLRSSTTSTAITSTAPQPTPPPPTDHDIWNKLMLQPHSDTDTDGTDLPVIPDHSHETTMWSSVFDPPVKESIQAVFSQLRLAGVKSGDQVDSWTHLVRALQEGIVLDVPIVLGGRDYDVGIQRGEEVLRKLNRTKAAQLVYQIRPTWKDDASPRDNFRAMRQLIRDTLPSFEQVMFQEVDAHAAQKLDGLIPFHSIVAIVMMIHMDGVEQQLKELGWTHVDVDVDME